MTLESSIQRRYDFGRRSRDETASNNFFVFTQINAIVPSSAIQTLTQQLERGAPIVRIRIWSMQIVHKYAEVFLRWWGVCVGRMTHEARLDVILQTYRAGAVYESDSLAQSIFVLRNASYKRFRKGRFLRASRTAEKGWATSVLKQLQDPKGALRLRRRYDDRVERPRICLLYTSDAADE